MWHELSTLNFCLKYRKRNTKTWVAVVQGWLLCADSHASGCLWRRCLHMSVCVHASDHSATDGQCKCQYWDGKNHGLSLVVSRAQKTDVFWNVSACYHSNREAIRKYLILFIPTLQCPEHLNLNLQKQYIHLKYSPGRKVSKNLIMEDGRKVVHKKNIITRLYKSVMWNMEEELWASHTLYNRKNWGLWVLWSQNGKKHSRKEYHCNRRWGIFDLDFIK